MNGWGLLVAHLQVFAGIAIGSVAIFAIRNVLERLIYRVESRMRSMRRSTRLVTDGAAIAGRIELPARTRPARHFGRFLPRSISPLTSATGALVFVMAASVSLAGDSWNSFQNGGELTCPTDGLPTEWSLDAGIAWRAPIDGTGQSSPVIQDGRVYVTSVSGANKETYHLSAYALADGSKQWHRDVANPSPQENSGYVSLAAPTPAADGRGVICFFEGGNLVALTPAGEPRWQRDLVAEYGPIVSRHGISASIEQNNSLAFIWVERQDDPYVMAVSKETGENVWKVGGIGATSWASPRLIKVGDQQHLVLSGIGSLTGLDPSTGERLWKFDSIAGNSTPTPSPAGDSRFLIGATTGQGASGGGNAAASNGLIEIRRGADGAWTADYVWRAKRATSSFGSPIASSGAAYFVNRTGVLYALDLATGEERYAERLGDSIWATPVAVGDRILFFGKGGRTFVVAAGSTFNKVSENASWTQSDPPPAAEGAPAGPPGATGGLVLYGVACTDAEIVLRSGDELVCVRGK